MNDAKMTWARLSILVLAGWGWLGAQTTNPPPQDVRLELTLEDGSRVIGVPGIETVPIRTEYARMDVPLAMIRKISREGTNEAVCVTMLNGDRVQGTCALPSLEVSALFGRVVIALRQVVAIGVVRYGTGGLTSRHALWDESLLGFWPLLGHARDAKGANHGVWVGAERYESAAPGGGKAATFSGNAHAVLLGKDFSFSSDQPVTMSAWVSLAEFNPQKKYGIILSMHSEANRFNAYLCSSGDVEGRVSFNVGESCVGDSYVIAARRPERNEWHHYAGVFDGREVCLYVDGVSQGSVKYTYGSLDSPSGALKVGPSVAADWWLLNGAVANVAVWRRALSAAEVSALYGLGIAPP